MPSGTALFCMLVVALVVIGFISITQPAFVDNVLNSIQTDEFGEVSDANTSRLRIEVANFFVTLIGLTIVLMLAVFAGKFYYIELKDENVPDLEANISVDCNCPTSISVAAVCFFIVFVIGMFAITIACTSSTNKIYKIKSRDDQRNLVRCELA
ncbi:hypothetical protein CAEBREN_08208 [Caenorhabditis brenneri]|uniref:Uncharacterized protein n=1 Tax=Caenorhabditis brenneri TaxID=135651 RepID=G0NGD7_CAEBE|nr:hypothetical protein CAEBREN_08208 [Caenorhabditis brenneri]